MQTLFNVACGTKSIEQLLIKINDAIQTRHDKKEATFVCHIFISTLDKHQLIALFLVIVLHGLVSW